MTRPKQLPIKLLSPEEQAKWNALCKEEAYITEWLFDHMSDEIGYGAMTRRLHEVGKKILDIEGGKPLDVNSDFRR